ncbi:MAG TPA: hypothetical protein VMI53_10890 [Opitutaceae bacterium]|nr:hypothetical protein [Opitutaceae bacterium]
MKAPLPRFLLLLAAWGLAATAAGVFHLFFRVPPFVIPVLVASLTTALTVAALRPTWIGDAVGQIRLRPLLAIHLVRFIGFYFLWLHTQGRLPAEFADRAGWGDIVAAAGALGLLFWPDGPGFRRALAVWNVIGLADLVVAVGTGGWLSFVRHGSMAELRVLPMVLVPLWLVPMAMSSHFVIFRRLGGRTAVAAV